jgi:hypothetical protein
MTNASLNEWKEIEDTINFFYKASGLKVNVQKSTTLFAGLSDAELNPFRNILPYSFAPISTCFRYLGCYLSTGPHRNSDWNWLLTKLGNKIDLQCNRWLSLGGRYILVKSTLESMPFYWLSLAIIPCSVLN